MRDRGGLARLHPVRSGDPAIATAEIVSEHLHGADYVRVTVVLTVTALDVTDALAIGGVRSPVPPEMAWPAGEIRARTLRPGEARAGPRAAGSVQRQSRGRVGPRQKRG